MTPTTGSTETGPTGWDADLRPMPGATPIARMVRSQIGMETRLLLRNGEQLLLALGIPVIALIAGAYGPFPIEPDLLVPGVLALAVLSTSFTSLAIATGFDRRSGVLKRLGASPLPRAGLLAGKIGSVLLIEAGQLVVLSAVGLAIGWRPGAGGAGLLGLLAAMAIVIAGTAAFCSLGLLLAGTLRAEATLAAANLIYVVLLVGGAVVIPLADYPGAVQAVVQWTPSAALAEGMRDALSNGALPVGALMILLLWTAIGATLTARTFRWT